MIWLVLKQSIKSTQIIILKVLLNIPPEVNSRARQRFLGGSESEKKEKYVREKILFGK